MQEVEDATAPDAVSSELPPAPPERVEECEVFEGEIRALEGDRAVVSLLGGVEGVLPLVELGELPPDASTLIGRRMRLFVDHKELGAPRYVLSKEKADRLDLWRGLIDAFDHQTTIEGEIVGLVDGGFSVDIGVKAFLPASQLDLAPVRDPDRYVGQGLHFRIVKFHKSRSNIVLSRRVLLEEARASTLAQLKVGAVIEGVVKSFTDYGAFIDVGGVQGLLHITDMSWGKVGRPSEILSLADRVKVKVLKVDPATARVSLGLRQLQDDPWLEAKDRYAVGTVVTGTVVSITDYGLFLALEPGVEGLVHTTGSIGAPARDIARRISIGDQLSAVVIETDLTKKRISLGLKDSPTERR